jgi:hypothetical protein
MTQLTTLSTQGTILYSGPLPSSLGSLGLLQTLKVSGGPSNLGALPPEWGQLQELRELWLYNMQLTGTLPASYSSLTVLSQIGLYNTTFTDGRAQLPYEWSDLQVTHFELVNVTGLSGSIPSSWSSSSSALPQLIHLSVHYTPSLVATLDDWWRVIDRPGAPAQQTVLLNDNSMQGTVPVGMIDPYR